MLRYELISLTGGNVSMRLTDGTILVTPTGMRYETMTAEDIVRLDKNGNIVEGKRKPTSDSQALLYIYKKKSEVNAIIHTRQPYSTAAGLIGDYLPACTTGPIAIGHGDIPVTAFTVSSDIGMGVETVKCCRGSDAVILSNHGVIGRGRHMSEALETVVYLEEDAKIYLVARMAGKVKQLTQEQIEAEDSECEYYGQ